MLRPILHLRRHGVGLAGGEEFDELLISCGQVCLPAQCRAGTPHRGIPALQQSLSNFSQRTEFALVAVVLVAVTGGGLVPGEPNASISLVTKVPTQMFAVGSS